MIGNRAMRFRAARYATRLWPFTRGRQRLANLIVGAETNWPQRGDVRFRFGRIMDVSLKPWPYGFRELWCHGVLDEHETRLWLAVLRPGDTVVDGGANMGYWSLVGSRAVGREGRVIAVEPMPETAACLRRNLAASGARNVTVIEAALSDGAGEAVFHQYDSDPFACLSSQGKVQGLSVARQVRVRLSSAMQLTGGPVPALVKLDIEGGELPALRGMMDWLVAPTAPIITFEWNEATAEAMGYQSRNIVALLEERGYSCHLPAPGGLRPFSHPAGVTDWSPMVWAIKRDEHRSRLSKLRFS